MPRAKKHPGDTKTCSKCNETKDATEFYYNVCKPCRVVATLEWREKNPEAPNKHAKAWYKRNKEQRSKYAKAYRLANLDRYKFYDKKYREENRERRNAYCKSVARKYTLKRYGLTLDKYNEMYMSQEGKCAICRIWFERLDVDHNHSCCLGNKSCGNCIRGLIYHNHNTGIGYFQDNPETLRAAASYLEQHNQ